MNAAATLDNLMDDPTDDPRDFLYIQIGSLCIDERKQREIDPKKVDKIAANFQWELFEALTVVARPGEPGKYDIVEGQHRGAGALRFGGPSLMVPCMVLPPATTFQDQAKIALDIFQGRGKHTAYEQWRLRYNKGQEHVVLASAVLEGHGLRVGKGTSTMIIGAVAALYQIIHGNKRLPEDGADLLDLTIGTIKAAWPTHDHESSSTRWEKPMLLAVAGVFTRWPECDQQRVIRSLRIRPAAQWLSAGKAVGKPSADVAISYDIAANYNRNLRGGRLA